MNKGAFRSGKGYVDQIFILKQIGEKAHERNRKVYVGFLDVEKAYDRVNREALWQVPRTYDVSDKLLNRFKSIYVGSLSCVRVSGGKIEFFRIDRGLRLGCIMSPQFFNLHMNPVMKEVKMRIGRIGVRFMEEMRKWRLPDLLYTDNLGFCGESEENLTMMAIHFVEVYKRRGLKVKTDKSKVMVSGGEKGLECKIRVDGTRLQQVSEFKYLECVLDESGTEGRKSCWCFQVPW